MEQLVGVPIKPFISAKGRLTEVLAMEQRAGLARYLATNSLAAVTAAGVEVAVLAANDEVAAFADELGYAVLMVARPGLNRAATHFRDHAAARGAAWMIVHADLPYLTADALSGPLRILREGRPVIAPSADGGTSLIGHHQPEIEFVYGRASFQRHLRQIPAAHVFIDHRLGCDLDHPRDLDLARKRIAPISSLLDS